MHRQNIEKCEFEGVFIYFCSPVYVVRVGKIRWLKLWRKHQHELVILLLGLLVHYSLGLAEYKAICCLALDCVPVIGEKPSSSPRIWLLIQCLWTHL